MGRRGNGELTLPDAEQERIIAQANASGLPYVKVVCDRHPKMKAVDPEWKECQDPLCQEVMEARRVATRVAGAPTEEQKVAWRAQLTGQARPK